MAKKSKKNLQKILAKRQQLQQLNTSAAPASLPEPSEELKALPTVTQKSVAALPAYSHNRELVRTVISIAIIAALLIGVVIFDRQRDDLATFGNWLYNTLRLSK